MIEDYELIDFVRCFKKPRQKYESRDIFSSALEGQFYGRVTSGDILTLINRCRSLGLLQFVRNGAIRFL